ncbi:MAG: hypothetical protein DSM106950_42090 [Stigonema ocellatum SAG 48.90 = DSM 106950]|nr:hypothetical protein [Stigonema ocellatum SAG 48.90 = DSM 106950]
MTRILPGEVRSCSSGNSLAQKKRNCRVLHRVGAECRMKPVQAFLMLKLTHELLLQA